MKDFLPFSMLVAALLVTIAGTVAVISSYPGTTRPPEQEREQTVYALQRASIRQFDHQARLFVRAGKLREAERLLRKITQVRPGNAITQKLLSKVLFLRGALEESEMLCRQLAFRHPGDPVARNNLGEVLVARGFPESGLGELLAAERLSGGEKYIRYNLCRACALSGRFGPAENYWLKFLRTPEKRRIPEEAISHEPPSGTDGR